jgi:hypothetical protein
MLLKNLIEKYDKDHTCLTPNAIYSTTIHDNEVTTKVKLPKDIIIPEKDVEDLESDLHYAIEKVLKKFF